VVGAAVLLALGPWGGLLTTFDWSFDCRDKITPTFVKCSGKVCRGRSVECGRNCPCNIMCYGRGSCNSLHIRCPLNSTCNIAVHKQSFNLGVSGGNIINCYTDSQMLLLRHPTPNQTLGKAAQRCARTPFFDVPFVAEYRRGYSATPRNCPGTGLWTASCTRGYAGVLCSPEQLQPYCGRRLSGGPPPWDPPKLPVRWWNGQERARWKPNCSHHENRTYVNVKGSYGRTNNAIIGFTNLMLKVAQAPEKYTAVLPDWYLGNVGNTTFDYREAVDGFACIVERESVPKGATREWMRAEDTFHLPEATFRPTSMQPDLSLRASIMASLFYRPNSRLRDSVEDLDQKLAEAHRRLVGREGPPYAGLYAAIHLRNFGAEFEEGKYRRGRIDSFFEKFKHHEIELSGAGISRADIDKMTNEFLEKVLGNITMPIYVMTSPYATKELERIKRRYSSAVVTAPRGEGPMLDSLMALRSSVFVYNILSSLSLNIVLARGASGVNTVNTTYIASWIASSRIEPPS